MERLRGWNISIMKGEREVKRLRGWHVSIIEGEREVERLRGWNISIMKGEREVKRLRGGKVVWGMYQLSVIEGESEGKRFCGRMFQFCIGKEKGLGGWNISIMEGEERKRLQVWNVLMK